MANIKTKGDALRYTITFGMIYGIIYGLIRISYVNDFWTWIIIIIGIVCSVLYVAEIKGMVNLGK